MPQEDVTKHRRHTLSTKISKQGKRELREVLRPRYQRAAKHDKSKILDEFVAVAGCHRKHAIRLLTANGPPAADTPVVALSGMGFFSRIIVRA